MSDKLVTAVLHLGKNGLEVIAERNGRHRKIELVWYRKTSSDVAPKDWSAMVKNELDYQDSGRNPIPM